MDVFVGMEFEPSLEVYSFHYFKVYRARIYSIAAIFLILASLSKTIYRLWLLNMGILFFVHKIVNKKECFLAFPPLDEYLCILRLNRSIVWEKSFHHGGTIFLPWWNDIFSMVERLKNSISSP
ncbi:hypothetical protein [Bacteroides fluxus]|uniref:hypothetical protein n=1 Tax=Bacteroides fluxus TaxID=626930 RepID=UPI0026DB78FE|nr:hypothetical protein [Bacteroides fluxus]